MFIAAQFTTSINRGRDDKMWYIYTRQYYSAIKIIIIKK